MMLAESGSSGSPIRERGTSGGPGGGGTPATGGGMVGGGGGAGTSPTAAREGDVVTGVSSWGGAPARPSPAPTRPGEGC